MEECSGDLPLYFNRHYIYIHLAKCMVLDLWTPLIAIPFLADTKMGNLNKKNLWQVHCLGKTLAGPAQTVQFPNQVVWLMREEGPVWKTLSKINNLDGTNRSVSSIFRPNFVIICNLIITPIIDSWIHHIKHTAYLKTFIRQILIFHH